jgi:AbiV family abortive infection protein
MRPKAICDLVQLSDKEFFEQISTGFEHVLKNAIRINQDALLLREQERPNGCRILSGMAEEEAAKCLILIDAVRCPRNPPDTLSNQLSRFNDHLAKGLYAEACYWRPTDFKEFRSYVDNERQEFYLDGPNDIDWIFRNRILTNREQTIYVDYVADDDGKHYWQKPDEDKFLLPERPESLSFAEAFRDAGCAAPEALRLMADFWRPIVTTPDFTWMRLCELNHRTLKMLDEKGLVLEQPQAVYSTIVELWPFPMFSIDIQKIKGNKAKLREIQKKWTPYL